jgi:copper chaperone
MEKTVLKVNGMTCHHCEMAVIKSTEALNGVKKTHVDLKKGTVTVEYDSAQTQLDAIKATIDNAGYEVA